MKQKGKIEMTGKLLLASLFGLFMFIGCGEFFDKHRC
jgi:hypothetical protein